MESITRNRDSRRDHGKKGENAMIRVKTFTSQLKIFHTRNELLELDQAVNDFVASSGKKLISVGDAVTTGEKGESIGIIRVVAYEEPGEGARERVSRKMEEKLEKWTDEIENLRGRSDRFGTDARAKFQEQAADLRARRDTAVRKLKEMKKSGGEAWEDLRAGADAALDDLRKAVENAARKWKK